MFTTFTDMNLCKRAVGYKIEEYRKSDIREKNKRGTKPTLNIDEAMQLIVESKGLCKCCGREMIMHSWPKKPVGVPAVFAEGFNRQFSFDRINNNGTHSADNLQVVCLCCNIKLSDLEYNPSYFAKIPEGRFAGLTAYDEYEYAKVRFNEFEDACIKGKNRKYISAEVWKYHREQKAYMAYLHDIIYADRKQNNWKRSGVVASSELPAGGRTLDPQTLNFDYYVREKLGMSEAEINAEEQAAIEAVLTPVHSAVPAPLEPSLRL